MLWHLTLKTFQVVQIISLIKVCTQTIYIYIELSQLNNKKADNPSFKWANDMNRPFSKEDIQVPNKPMKRCPMPSVVRKEQITATMRSHFIPSRVARSKGTDSNKDGKENVKWGSSLGNGWQSLKWSVTIRPSTSTPREKKNTHPHKNLDTNTHSIIIHNIGGNNPNMHRMNR